jgi:uncharacterized membrane protein YpjA
MASFTKYIAYVSAAALAVILLWLIRGQIIEYNLQSDPILHTLKEIVKEIPIEINRKRISLSILGMDTVDHVKEIALKSL